ncbi:hypothetical protein [Streptomyces sp. NPDC000878]
MSELSRSSTTRRLISTDTEFIEERHRLVRRLRRSVSEEILPGLGTTYSAEFLAGTLQLAVLHLRDQVSARNTETPALVDSYYYKVLAKCRLAGLEDNPMLGWWRSFPQPRRVVFLDVSPETVWQRSAPRDGKPSTRLSTTGPHGPCARAAVRSSRERGTFRRRRHRSGSPRRSSDC